MTPSPIREHYIRWNFKRTLQIKDEKIGAFNTLILIYSLHNFFLLLNQISGSSQVVVIIVKVVVLVVVVASECVSITTSTSAS